MPAGGHPVDHVGSPQRDVALGQLLAQRRAQLPVFLVAHRARGAVGVDDHRDRGLRVGRGGNLRELPDAISELGRQVDTQHRAQFAVADRHHDQRFFRHETQNGGQGGDQCAGTVQDEVRSSCGHTLHAGNRHRQAVHG